MRHGNPDFHPRIKEARRKVAQAESALRRTVREVQKECNHPVVAHRDWKPSQYFGPSPGVRICTSCGYEEYYHHGTATYWVSGWQTDRLGNSLEGSYSQKSKLDKRPLILTDDPFRYKV